MSGTSDLPATIVVDVGAGAIRAAVVAGSGSWLVTEPTTGLACWPAAAHWDGEQLRVGTAAERAREEDPDGYWSELTRCLTIDTAVPHGQRAFRPVDMLTALLRAVVGEAERRHGMAIDRALLTVPARHGPGGRHRSRLIAAAEAAGPATVELLSEPVATGCLLDLPPVTAAAHAGRAGGGTDGALWPGGVGAGRSAGAPVLVCDLGAGSFDATLLRLGGEPEILGTDTVEGAGRELDALIEERIYRDALPWLGPLLADAAQHPGAPVATRLGIAFTDFARRLKHQLSAAPVAQDLMLPGTPVYRLGRDALDDAVAPLLDRLVACCERLLYRFGAKPDDLATVVLAGGGARLPVVPARLAQALGQPPYQLAEPELMVLTGAVRWLSRRGRPVVAPEPLPHGTLPLAFAVPGGQARLTRWLVGPGQPYTAGTTLARVRLPNGALWDLAAAEPGRLDRVLVEPDGEVHADQWVALAVVA